MKIKVGDTVQVITGSNKGSEGKVLKVLKKDNRVIVDGINIVHKHVKPSAQNETGGILDVEAPIHISNVKVINKKEIKKEAKKDKTKEVVKEAKPKKAKTKKIEEEK